MYSKEKISNIKAELLLAMIKLINLRRPGNAYFNQIPGTVSKYYIHHQQDIRDDAASQCEKAQDLVRSFYEYAKDNYDLMNDNQDIWVTYNFMKKLCETPLDVEDGEIDWWVGTVMPDLRKL